MFQYKPFKFRLAAGLLLAAFLCQEMAYAAPELKAVFWASETGPKLPFALPASVAALDDSWASRGNSRTIYLIQDAHTNESGQINLSKALDQILRHDKEIKYVFTEAGTGDVSVSFLRGRASSRSLERATRTYLKKGLLHGAEHLQLTGDAEFTLWGVEDEGLYRRALEAYRQVAAHRVVFEAYLHKMETAADSLKINIFDPALFAFEQKYAAALDRRTPLADYFEVLLKEARGQGLPAGDYPHLSRIAELRRQEEKIDFAKANEEALKAAASLPETARAELQLFSDAARQTAARLGQDKKGERAYFAFLRENLGVSLSLYPELQKYSAYLETARSLDLAAALEEQKRAEAALFERLARTDDEKGLLRSLRVIRGLRGLMFFSLTPEEFADYKELTADFSIGQLTGFLNRKRMDIGGQEEQAVFLNGDFEEAARVSERFYALTAERDAHFVKALLEKMNTEGQSRAVLITGGYHTPHLKSLLRRQGISFYSILPQVFHETNVPKYEKLLLNQVFPQPRPLPEAGHLMLWALAGTPAVRSFAVEAGIKRLPDWSGARMAQSRQERLITDFLNRASLQMLLSKGISNDTALKISENVMEQGPFQDMGDVRNLLAPSAYSSVLSKLSSVTAKDVDGLPTRRVQAKMIEMLGNLTVEARSDLLEGFFEAETMHRIENWFRYSTHRHRETAWTLDKFWSDIRSDIGFNVPTDRAAAFESRLQELFMKSEGPRGGWDEVYRKIAEQLNRSAAARREESESAKLRRLKWKDVENSPAAAASLLGDLRLKFVSPKTKALLQATAEDWIVRLRPGTTAATVLGGVLLEYMRPEVSDTTARRLAQIVADAPAKRDKLADWVDGAHWLFSALKKIGPRASDAAPHLLRIYYTLDHYDSQPAPEGPLAAAAAVSDKKFLHAVGVAYKSAGGRYRMPERVTHDKIALQPKQAIEVLVNPLFSKLQARAVLSRMPYEAMAYARYLSDGAAEPHFKEPWMAEAPFAAAKVSEWNAHRRDAQDRLIVGWGLPSDTSLSDLRALMMNSEVRQALLETSAEPTPSELEIGSHEIPNLLRTYLVEHLRNFASLEAAAQFYLRVRPHVSEVAGQQISKVVAEAYRRNLVYGSSAFDDQISDVMLEFIGSLSEKSEKDLFKEIFQGYIKHDQVHVLMQSARIPEALALLGEGGAAADAALSRLSAAQRWLRQNDPDVVPNAVSWLRILREHGRHLSSEGLRTQLIFMARGTYPAEVRAAAQEAFDAMPRSSENVPSWIQSKDPLSERFKEGMWVRHDGRGIGLVVGVSEKDPLDVRVYFQDMAVRTVSAYQLRRFEGGTQPVEPTVWRTLLKTAIPAKSADSETVWSPGRRVLSPRGQGIVLEAGPAVADPLSVYPSAQLKIRLENDEEADFSSAEWLALPKIDGRTAGRKPKKMEKEEFSAEPVAFTEDQMMAVEAAAERWYFTLRFLSEKLLGVPFPFERDEMVSESFLAAAAVRSNLESAILNAQAGKLAQALDVSAALRDMALAVRKAVREAQSDGLTVRPGGVIRLLDPEMRKEIERLRQEARANRPEQIPRNRLFDSQIERTRKEIIDEKLDKALRVYAEKHSDKAEFLRMAWGIGERDMPDKEQVAEKYGITLAVYYSRRRLYTDEFTEFLQKSKDPDAAVFLEYPDALRLLTKSGARLSVSTRPLNADGRKELRKFMEDHVNKTRLKILPAALLGEKPLPGEREGLRDLLLADLRELFTFGYLDKFGTEEEVRADLIELFTEEAPEEEGPTPLEAMTILERLLEKGLAEILREFQHDPGALADLILEHAPDFPEKELREYLTGAYKPITTSEGDSEAKVRQMAKALRSILDRAPGGGKSDSYRAVYKRFMRDAFYPLMRLDEERGQNFYLNAVAAEAETQEDPFLKEMFADLHTFYKDGREETFTGFNEYPDGIHEPLIPAQKYTISQARRTLEDENERGALVSSSARTGKTAPVTLTALNIKIPMLVNRKHPRIILYTTKNAAKPEVEEELKRRLDPALKAQIFVTGKTEKMSRQQSIDEALKAKVKAKKGDGPIIVIANYESVRDFPHLFAALDVDVHIIDEIDNLRRGGDTKRAPIIFGVPARHRIGIAARPLVKSKLDLIEILSWVRRDAMVKQGITRAQLETFTPDALYGFLDPVMVRWRRQTVLPELGEPEEIVERLPLSPLQERTITALRKLRSTDDFVHWLKTYAVPKRSYKGAIGLLRILLERMLSVDASLVLRDSGLSLTFKNATVRWEADQSKIVLDGVEYQKQMTKDGQIRIVRTKDRIVDAVIRPRNLPQDVKLSGKTYHVKHLPLSDESPKVRRLDEIIAGELPPTETDPRFGKVLVLVDFVDQAERLAARYNKLYGEGTAAAVTDTDAAARRQKVVDFRSAEHTKILIGTTAYLGSSLNLTPLPGRPFRARVLVRLSLPWWNQDDAARLVAIGQLDPVTAFTLIGLLPEGEELSVDQIMNFSLLAEEDAFRRAVDPKLRNAEQVEDFLHEVIDGLEGHEQVISAVEAADDGAGPEQGARLAETSVRFLARVYAATRETGRLQIDESVFEISEEEGFLVIHGLGRELLRTKDYQKAAAADGTAEITLTQTDIQTALQKAFAVADEAPLSDVLDGMPAVAEIDVRGWEDWLVQILFEELALAHNRPWGRQAKFLLRSDRAPDLPANQNYIVAAEADLGEHADAKRILVTAPGTSVDGLRHFFIQSPKAGDVPNLRGMIRAALSLARVEALEATDPRFLETAGFVGTLLGHPITDLAEFIRVTENPSSVSVERIDRFYALPKIIRLPLSQIVGGARLAVRMIRQSA